MKFFKGLFEMLIGFMILAVIFVVGGWLLMVALYHGFSFVGGTNWWQGITDSYGHIIGLIAFLFIVVIIPGFFVSLGDKK